MLEATRSIPGQDVTAGRTRVSSDHWLASAYPGHFKEATDGPPDMIRRLGPRPACTAHVRDPGERRGSGSPQRSSRPPLAEEDRVRRRTLQEFDAEDRVESESGRRARLFWGSTESFLRANFETAAERETRAREEREDQEQAEVEAVIAGQAQTELDAIDEAWGSAAPWPR